jgi:hypothetical protein
MATFVSLLNQARDLFQGLLDDYPGLYSSQTDRLKCVDCQDFTSDYASEINASCLTILSAVEAFWGLAVTSGTTPTASQDQEITQIQRSTLRIAGYACYKAGQWAYYRKKWSEAANQYRQAIGYHQELGIPHRKAHYYLAYALYKLGANSGATLAAYEETVQRAWSKNKAAHYYFALHRYQLGDLDGALAATHRGLIISFDPANLAQAQAHGKLEALWATLQRGLTRAYNPDNYYTFRYSPADAADAVAVAGETLVAGIAARLSGGPLGNAANTTFRPKLSWEHIEPYTQGDYTGSGYHGFTGTPAERFAQAAVQTMNVWRAWAMANESYVNGFFSSALENYDQVDRLLADYWQSGTPPTNFPYFQHSLAYRANEILTLTELQLFDWDIIADLKTKRDYYNLFRGQYDRFLFYFFVELKLMLLHRILLPLARAETLMAQDRFAEADSLFDALLSEPNLNKHIEKAYVRRRRAENMLAWADTLYKAGTLHATGQSEAAADKYLRVLKIYPEYLQAAFDGPPAPTPTLNDVLPLQMGSQLLPAAQENLLPAVNRQFTGYWRSKILNSNLFNVRSVAFNRSADEISWQSGLRNPLVLRLLKLASVGLMKLRGGMNFLGYSDEYVPIWRYSFLLEQARYFADRARAAERDALNFFEKGYAEEEKARNLAQAMATQSLSLRMAGTKVEQMEQRTDIAQAQADLFDLRMQNAERNAQEAVLVGLASAFSYSVSVSAGFMGASVSAGVSFSPGAIAQGYAKAREIQRGIQEMGVQQDIARQEKVLAEMETRMAEMSHDIESLNQVFAQDNLNYLKSKPLNRELWFNLGRTMRQIARQYLQQTITLAWMAEQAYEYEYDRRLDVIKFDYSNANTEDLLGADLLLSDLDAIEYDRLSTLQNKQLPLKFTLALSEHDPIAFQRFRRTGLMALTTTLESLDLKFPGVYLARVQAVEVKLNALVGRASVVAGRLTHHGVSTFRFKAGGRPLAPPSTDPTAPESFSNVVADYIPGAGDHGFMLRLASQPPETLVLSNFELRQDGVYFAPDASGQQLRVFENVGFAGEWTLEISPSANDFDFDTIMEVELTFYLTARYDETLHYLVEDYYRNLVKIGAAAGEPLSAGQPYLFKYTFPDAYYALLNPDANGNPQQVGVQITPALFAHNHQNVRVDKIHFYVGAETDLSQYRIRVGYNGQVTTGALGGPLVTAHCGPPIAVDLGGAKPPFEFNIMFLDAAGDATIVQDLIDVGLVIEYRYDLRGLAPVLADFQPREAAVGQTVTLLGRGFDHDDIFGNQVAVNDRGAAIQSINPFGTEMEIKIPTGATTGRIRLRNVWGETASDRDLVIT